MGNKNLFKEVLSYVNQIDVDYLEQGERVSLAQGAIEFAYSCLFITEDEAKECYRALIERCGNWESLEECYTIEDNMKIECICAVIDEETKFIFSWYVFECGCDSFGDRMTFGELNYYKKHGKKFYTMDDKEII